VGRLLFHWRGTQRYRPTVRNNEDALTRAIIALASEYGRYGYRRITVLLREAGWNVGKDLVERMWRREGLKVPRRQRPRGRLWLTDGSCIRRRPEHRNQVWSYDFVSGSTSDGRTLRMLTMIDEYTRESLAIRVGRRLNSYDVIHTLAETMVEHGVPEHIRRTTAPNSSPTGCANGWRGWEPSRCTSSRVVRGKTATVNRSTASCATSSSMARSFTH
jgi:putative transposase